MKIIKLKIYPSFGRAYTVIFEVDEKSYFYDANQCIEDWIDDNLQNVDHYEFYHSRFIS